MYYRFEEGKDLIIEAVVGKFQHKLPSAQAELCAEFIRQFLSNVALEDLRTWIIDDLYGAMNHLWLSMQKRASNEIKLRIYNPVYEQDGWQSPNTIVELICSDMSFVVDSMRMVCHRTGIASHLIIHMGGVKVKRNPKDGLTAVLPRTSDMTKGVQVEAPIWMEVDRITDEKAIETLRQEFLSALEDTRVSVEDWQEMRDRVRESVDELMHAPNVLNADEISETIAFLNWLVEHHFTFLGIRDYALQQEQGNIILHAVEDTGLGILREQHSPPHKLNISAMSPLARELSLSPHILIVSKTNTRSTVHRDTYTDYIGIKRFNAKGEVIGERRILGLFTSMAYNTSPKQIPFLRHKVAAIMQHSQLSPRSHASKVLMNILETLPRDDLIQASEEELLEISMGIYYMQERRRIRLFARQDIYHRFISCLVYVPKSKFNTILRRQMQAVLKESFQAEEISFSTYYSESILVRIHYLVRVNPERQVEYDYKQIEQKLTQVARQWSDDFQELLQESYGEDLATKLFNRYKKAFAVDYTAIASPRTAVSDVQHREQLNESNTLVMNFYKPVDQDDPKYFKFKIYQKNDTIPLSDVLPIIENLGLRAISERPYKLTFSSSEVAWINEFSLKCSDQCTLNVYGIKERLQTVFAKVWFNETENDGFNKLVLIIGLDWHQVSALRAYAKYFKQIGLPFSQDYIESALIRYPNITRQLVALFETRHRPDQTIDTAPLCDDLTAEIIKLLDGVDNLDEDKIFRLYVHVISATVRTNYFQKNHRDDYKSYLSFKIRSAEVPNLPKPHPLYEIFVYSPAFEGIHLRTSKVARGGLRWSDRREDFRSEVLGLMKAQQVKNAVIVPSGAKGGFVVKRQWINETRDEILNEGIRCYQQFIRGLLDITDNWVKEVLISPKQVKCYDDEDPYLVVAADKGTATFSDIANAISLEYGFWLGDAFASGGSVGYDHKKMGITAKGAWESVKRHFHELNQDIAHNDFTVVGIGDMAGDVFGNGMLLSQHIQLVAAFNHMHIFIDPNPNAAESYLERERLFHMPRSNWTDYNQKLISKGGGVFNRNAKSIPVSREMKQRFDLKSSQIEPNELIQCLLQSECDLLWSGGIGTFVKAESETHLDVGDRANDLIRVDAKTLGCKVVGEGGNLGFTQLARIEYALHGGKIYTDFIDNSAGVSCSDKEVNLKILLNSIVAAADMTLKQRNELLSQMTEEVEQWVLRDNYLQTRAISLIASQGPRLVGMHIRYINELVRLGQLDRKLEFLPTDQAILENKLLGKGLTTPAIAVLTCYSKNLLKEVILQSDIPEESYLDHYLISSFPTPLQSKKFAQLILQHPLKREILATSLSNCIVNEMGFSFVYRMQDETGAPASAVVRAFLITRQVLGLSEVWKQVEGLDGKIEAQNQLDIMINYARLARRITRWFLRMHRTRLELEKMITLYSSGLSALIKSLPDCLGEGFREQYDIHYQEFQKMGIPDNLAREFTTLRGLFSAMDLIEISQKLDISIKKSSEAYFAVGEFLDLGWVRQQVIIHSTENHWEALSREALRDDLDWQQRQLTMAILQFNGKQSRVKVCLEDWAAHVPLLIERWRLILSNLRQAPSLNYTMFFVVTRELLDLTQTTAQIVQQ